MNNPRENIKYDIPNEWLQNFKEGCCPVCGKTKFEFDKGMRIYCSEKCRKTYSKHILTWGELKDRIIKEKGERCNKCHITKETYEKKLDEDCHNKIVEYLKTHPEIIELQRKEWLELSEKYYKLAFDLDKVIQDIIARKINYYSLEHNERIDIPYEVTNRYDTRSLCFEVDHIKAVCNGGNIWDENNLQVLCTKCHKEKTIKDLIEKKKNQKENQK